MISLRLLFLLSALLLGLSACGGDATPPTTAPNEDPAPPEDGLNAEPGTVEVPSASEPSGATPGDGDTGDASQDTEADSLISSPDGAFPAAASVEVGVLEAQDPHAVLPKLGPAEGADPASLTSLFTLSADINGAIAFGVYISADTTPGSYTLFAESGDLRYTVAISVVDAE